MVPQASLGSPSIPPHPKNPTSLLQPSLETPRPPSLPRVLAHMFTHAGTEQGGKPRCRNNTGTQTKEHKPLIWVNRRK